MRCIILLYGDYYETEIYTANIPLADWRCIDYGDI